MAGLVQDCFTIGSIVECTTCFEANIEGEVMAFDQQTKMLILSILFQLSTRARNQVEQKRLQLTALSAGVSPEGQNLYMAIARTIKQVTWSGPNIVVCKDVTITPPYKVDNVNSSDQRQLSYVKKIVEKHENDQANINQSTSAADIAAN
uniref:AD domain-containing protein n=1 Tax=Anopheles culicifacies TaxID=139723 RepID=A0A182LX51_9DIPT